jgi:hypothetical protein
LHRCLAACPGRDPLAFLTPPQFAIVNWAGLIDDQIAAYQQSSVDGRLGRWSALC